MALCAWPLLLLVAWQAPVGVKCVAEAGSAPVAQPLEAKTPALQKPLPEGAEGGAAAPLAGTHVVWVKAPGLPLAGAQKTAGKVMVAHEAPPVSALAT